MSDKVFCIVPWVHLHVWPNGQAYPCCLTSWNHPVGNINQTPMIDVWNSDGMKQLRKNIIAGVPSDSCSRCYECEENGGRSHRQNLNDDYKHRFHEVEETHSDGTVDEMSLSYYDIRFSNFCNFKCRTCGPELSSGWYEDSVALGHIPDTAKKFIRLHETPDQVWEEIAPHLSKVEKIYFAGGEPLLIDEHYKILKYLIANNQTDVFLGYNTNFSTLKYKDNNCLELWKHFSKVYIGVSLDGYGEIGEYIRDGLVWSRLEDNIRQFKAALPNADLIISCTLSIFNALHMPEFHRYMVDQGLIKPGDWDVNILLYPEHYRIQMLPDQYKDEFFKKYQDTIDWLEQNTTLSRAADGYRAAMAAVKNAPPVPPERLTKFRALTAQLDQLRKQDFATTFKGYNI